MSHHTFDVTDQDFKAQVLDSAVPVLVEFTADWCPPCKMLAPIVHDIARKYEGKLRVGLLDNDVNPQTIQEYGVMGLPTLILFVNGQPVERIMGFKPRERIEAKLVPHLALEQA
jgi:thioredoxin 1